MAEAADAAALKAYKKIYKIFKRYDALVQHHIRGEFDLENDDADSLRKAKDNFLSFLDTKTYPRATWDPPTAKLEAMAFKGLSKTEIVNATGNFDHHLCIPKEKSTRTTTEYVPDTDMEFTPCRSKAEMKRFLERPQTTPGECDYCFATEVHGKKHESHIRDHVMSHFTSTEDPNMANYTREWMCKDYAITRGLVYDPSSVILLRNLVSREGGVAKCYACPSQHVRSPKYTAGAKPTFDDVLEAMGESSKEKTFSGGKLFEGNTSENMLKHVMLFHPTLYARLMGAWLSNSWGLTELEHTLTIFVAYSYGMFEAVPDITALSQDMLTRMSLYVSTYVGAYGSRINKALEIDGMAPVIAVVMREDKDDGGAGGSGAGAAKGEKRKAPDGGGRKRKGKKDEGDDDSGKGGGKKAGPSKTKTTKATEKTTRSTESPKEQTLQMKGTKTKGGTIPRTKEKKRSWSPMPLEQQYQLSSSEDEEEKQARLKPRPTAPGPKPPSRIGEKKQADKPSSSSSSSPPIKRKQSTKGKEKDKDKKSSDEDDVEKPLTPGKGFEPGLPPAPPPPPPQKEKAPAKKQTTEKKKTQPDEGQQQRARSIPSQAASVARKRSGGTEEKKEEPPKQQQLAEKVEKKKAKDKTDKKSDDEEDDQEQPKEPGFPFKLPEPPKKTTKKGFRYSLSTSPTTTAKLATLSRSAVKLTTTPELDDTDVKFETIDGIQHVYTCTLMSYRNAIRCIENVQRLRDIARKQRADGMRHAWWAEPVSCCMTEPTLAANLVRLTIQFVIPLNYIPVPVTSSPNTAKIAMAVLAAAGRIYAQTEGDMRPVCMVKRRFFFYNPDTLHVVTLMPAFCLPYERGGPVGKLGLLHLIWYIMLGTRPKLDNFTDFTLPYISTIRDVPDPKARQQLNAVRTTIECDFTDDNGDRLIKKHYNPVPGASNFESPRFMIPSMTTPDKLLIVCGWLAALSMPYRTVDMPDSTQSRLLNWFDTQLRESIPADLAISVTNAMGSRMEKAGKLKPMGEITEMEEDVDSDYEDTAAAERRKQKQSQKKKKASTVVKAGEVVDLPPGATTTTESEDPSTSAQAETKKKKKKKQPPSKKYISDESDSTDEEKEAKPKKTKEKPAKKKPTKPKTGGKKKDKTPREAGSDEDDPDVEPPLEQASSSSSESDAGVATGAKKRKRAEKSSSSSSSSGAEERQKKKQEKKKTKKDDDEKSEKKSGASSSGTGAKKSGLMVIKREVTYPQGTFLGFATEVQADPRAGEEAMRELPPLKVESGLYGRTFHTIILQCSGYQLNKPRLILKADSNPYPGIITEGSLAARGPAAVYDFDCENGQLNKMVPALRLDISGTDGMTCRTAKLYAMDTGIWCFITRFIEHVPTPGTDERTFLDIMRAILSALTILRMCKHHQRVFAIYKTTPAKPGAMTKMVTVADVGGTVNLGDFEPKNLGPAAFGLLKCMYRVVLAIYVKAGFLAQELAIGHFWYDENRRMFVCNSFQLAYESFFSKKKQSVFSLIANMYEIFVQLGIEKHLPDGARRALKKPSDLVTAPEQTALDVFKALGLKTGVLTQESAGTKSWLRLSSVPLNCYYYPIQKKDFMLAPSSSRLGPQMLTAPMRITITKKPLLWENCLAAVPDSTMPQEDN